jgi:hypothetical protein
MEDVGLDGDVGAEVRCWSCGDECLDIMVWVLLVTGMVWWRLRRIFGECASYIVVEICRASCSMGCFEVVV